MDIHGSFADIHGSFVDIHGSFADMQRARLIPHLFTGTISFFLAGIQGLFCGSFWQICKALLRMCRELVWCHINQVCCGVLRCVAVCCGVLQCVAVCRGVLRYVAECCGVLQCVAVCCSVLQICRELIWNLII